MLQKPVKCSGSERMKRRISGALTDFYLYHSQVPSRAETFLWAWETSAELEALSFTSFMLRYIPHFGMPLYISTLIFKGHFPALLLCSCSGFDTPLLRWGVARARTVFIDFRVCAVTFSPAVHCERGERCTLTVSGSAWEHNHFWLTGELQAHVSDPFFLSHVATTGLYLILHLHTDNTVLASV